MSEPQSHSDNQSAETEPTTRSATYRASGTRAGRASIRSWLLPLLQPLAFLVAGALLIVGLGLAQRIGWISAGSGQVEGMTAESNNEANARYVCPMMCTPPQTEPGRCPVCAMELVVGDLRRRQHGRAFDPNRRRCPPRRKYPHRGRESSAAGAHDPGDRRTALRRRDAQDHRGLRRRPIGPPLCRLHRRGRERGRPFGLGLFSATVFGTGRVAGRRASRGGEAGRPRSRVPPIPAAASTTVRDNG